MQHLKKFGLLTAAMLAPVMAFAVDPEPGPFGAFVSFADITNDVTYLGWLLIGLTLLVVGIKIVQRLVKRA